MLPKFTKYNKYQTKTKTKKNKFGYVNQTSSLKFGSVGLISTQNGRCSINQLRTAEGILKHKIKGQFFKYWKRIFPQFSVTSKSVGVRIGKGKGSIDYWASNITPGLIIFEISCLDNELAKKALVSLSKRLSFSTSIVYKNSFK